ncbi:MAG TPA: EamA family transporter [Pirellulales bacterium]|nr:EamA family transporter [Pirellulales bacterium]
MIWFCVFARIFANPCSNVLQKMLTRNAAHPLFVICATHALLSLAVAPVLLSSPASLPAEFWRNIAICTLLNVAGNALLVQAVKLSDLSVLGPINAFKAIVSLLPGALLLGEIPGAAGLSGMLLIFAGAGFLAEREAAEWRPSALVRLFRDPGVRYRFAALVLSASEAVFLKQALVASSPMTTFAYWSVLGFGASLVAVAVVLGKQRAGQELRVFGACKSTYLMLFATTGVMQLSTIVALEQLKVGYALALFQTSSLVSVLLGRHFFQEQDFARRMGGSLVMVAGAMLIVAAR